MISPLVRRLGRLGVRLWVPFLLLAIGSLVAGAAAFCVAYTDQRHHVASLQEEVLARASLRVSDYLPAIGNSMVAGAQALSVVDDDPTAEQRYLRSLLDANPALTALALIDPSGQETAKVNRKRAASEQGLDGQPVIGARQPFTGTDWGVITELPAREAYRTANLFVLTSALIFLALLAAVLGRGWFITRRVVQPLVALCRGSAIFGRGNLYYRIEVDASGEIEELATEFNIMATSLQRSQVETRDRQREVSSLVEAGRAITSLDLQRVLGTLAQEAARAVEAQACIIYILNEPLLMLEPSSVWSRPGKEYGPTPQLVGEGVAGWIAEHAQALRVEDIHSDPRFADQGAAYAYRSLLGLPLSVSGRLVGV